MENKSDQDKNKKKIIPPTMGAYGVYDELDSIQQDIENLNSEIADRDVNDQLINKVNQYNSKALVLRSLSIWCLLVVGASFFGIKVLPDQVGVWLSGYEHFLSKEVFCFILIGVFAQLVDGALGMGYGVLCNSFLLLLGISPVYSSAGIHTAEIFTTGASGLSHLKFKNVNFKLFKTLLLPGVLGAIWGAFLLTEWKDVFFLKPIIATYLFVLGVRIVVKFVRKDKMNKTSVNVRILALIGGFADAIGGGGWGAIVTTKLISAGRTVNYTIGSVNLTEFFVALAGSSIFVIFLNQDIWPIIIGLIIGGIIAAPFAAFSVRYIKKDKLLLSVGVLIILVSLLNLYYSDWVSINGVISSFLNN
ncbi:MAG: sulfite exporter TauE/SafE family protein [Cytophagaceae bacterium]